MAIRPVFSVVEDNSVRRENIAFHFYSGFSLQQKQRSIADLHRSYLLYRPGGKILEISTKSTEELGVQLSAFNLRLILGDGRSVPVECAFQAGKVFELGGPYLELLERVPWEIKKDSRLRGSGNVIAFELNGQRFSTEPKTLFYNWVYINALSQHSELLTRLQEYNAFTDIEFNPTRSINCQAEAVTIAVSLLRRGLLEDALSNIESFEQIVYPTRRG